MSPSTAPATTAPAIPPGDVVGMLTDNLRLRGSVVPLGRAASSGWARALDLPRGGPQVLYTGQMYQLMPYLETLSQARAKIADSPLARMSGLGRRINRFVNVTAFLGRPSRTERDRVDRILTDITAVLRAAGVTPGYLYEDDLYTGALVYDYGEDEVVRTQGLRILTNLRAAGVEEIITVDPHTTHMMRSVFPSMIHGFDVRVRNYLDVLAESAPPARRTLDETAVIHDSCLFARAENVIEAPRELLRGSGVNLPEADRSGSLTWCCGGPAESLYPERAAANARIRVEQLREVAGTAVTMCPVCLINLSKAADGGLHLEDVSHYLRRAYDD
ncbi:MAG: (Fe-S)-binding protein [Kineosporiaceae bacterium]|jgi:Fe-S oxidoreductase